MAQKIVDDIKATVHRDINFMDEHGVIIASTDHRRIGELHLGAQRVVTRKLEALIVPRDNREEHIREGINLPIQVNRETIGVIGITGSTAEVKDLGLVVKKMTELMVSAVHQKEIESSLKAARFNLLEQWLFPDSGAGEQDDQRFLQTAELLGIKTNTPRIIAVCDYTPEPATEQQTSIDWSPNWSNPDPDADLVQHFRMILAESEQTFCISVNRRIVILFAEEDLETVLGVVRKLRIEANSFFGLRLFCGISGVTEDYRLVWKCYREALAACRLAENTRQGIVVYDLLKPEFLSQALPKEFVTGLYEKLFRRCSAREIREILDTLSVFYRHNGNYTRAAAELFIHPNTFIYRLSKVQEKTGLNPRNPRDTVPLFLISACDYLPAEGEKEQGRKADANR